VIWGLVQGLLAFALVGSIFVLASRGGMPADEARALTFFSLVTTIVALIFVNRSFSTSLVSALRRPNLALTFVLAWVATILSLTLFWPFASELFRFGPLHADDLALTLGAGGLALAALELLKPLSRQRAAG
jgi:Ca2+-transporting ATPase